MTEAFLARHPDWVARYGERARTAGVEDAAFHLDFLAAAVEARSPAVFVDYVRWTRRVLQARGIAGHFLAENLLQIETALGGDVGPAVAPYLAEGRAACLEAADGVAPARDGAYATERRLFLAAILGGQRRAATGIAREALRRGAPLEDVYVEVFQGALYEVGRLWEANRITVADEHMATAIVQYVIAHLYEQLDRPVPAHGRLVVAGLAGELHQLGANMIADVLETRGWDVRFLGTNVPASGILAAVQTHAPDVIGLSMTMVSNLGRMRELIEALRGAGPGAARIVVGGAAFRAAATLWQDVGADLYLPDLRAAARLLGTPPPARA